MKNSPLKIIYVYYHLAYTGGVVRVLIDKMNYLSDHGCEITLVTYEQGDHPMFSPLNNQINHIDTNTRFFPLYNYPAWKRWIMSLKKKKQFKSRLQDIVNNINPNIIITVAGDVHSCYAVSKIKTNAKRIVESHSNKNYTFNGPYKKKRIILDSINTRIQYNIISKFDILVALTKGSAYEWSKIAKKTIVIPNPVTFYPTVIFPRTESKRIMSAGRIDIEKGFDRLIDAFALIADKCPEWIVDIFGEGKEKKSLNNRIQALGLEGRIIIHPATTHIYNEYNCHDFYVLSSRYEGLPLVLLEAMSNELPCVAFRCKYGPEDIITDKKDGLLVKDGDINDLAEKMLWMCQHHETRLEMGKRSRIKSSEYTKDVIMPKWLDLFMTICKK